MKILERGTIARFAEQSQLKDPTRVTELQ